MRVLVLGAGLVGRELAHRLTTQGHEVVATTTTEAKVADLQQVATEVHVLRGSDTDAVAKAAVGADAVVVCVGPDARRAMTPEERAATYDEVLVQTARSVVTAVPSEARIVALSSLSVYGDAADGLEVVTEDAPLTTDDDASPQKFQEMERIYLARGNAVVFRCSDIFGAGDPPIADKVRFAHTALKGSVPFSADALFYRVHVDDVLGAIEHAVAHDLEGVYNLTHADVPASNRQRFDTISAEQGLPPLTYRDELKAPSRPVSVDRLAATGFTTSHTPVER